MEHCIITITLVILTSLNSCTMAAPTSTVQLLDISFIIETLLAPQIMNTTEEMKKAYPYIKASSQSLQPSITLGLHTLQKTCSAMKQQEQLTEMYKQLEVFQAPLNLAYSSEWNRTELQRSIMETCHWLRDAVQATEYLLHALGIAIPTVKTINFADMNLETEQYLNNLMNYQKTTLTSITQDNVKSYRNYVVIYTLHEAVMNIQNCIPSA